MSRLQQIKDELAEDRKRGDNGFPRDMAARAYLIDLVVRLRTYLTDQGDDAHAMWKCDSGEYHPCPKVFDQSCTCGLDALLEETKIEPAG